MPPHVDIDAHHDEWPEERSPTSLLADDEHYSSPLFRDYCELPPKVPPEARLDLRQSDPDLSAAAAGTAPTMEAAGGARAAPPPPVSRITAIIGPESRYVRAYEKGAVAGTKAGPGTSNKGGGDRPPPSPPVPAPRPRKPASNPNPFARASARASKKGWKVMKSLPNKLASTVGNVKVSSVKVKVPVPHYRNAV